MPRRQMLVTKALRAQFPPLYATEKVPLAEKVIVAKFFVVSGSGTFYAVEFDGEDLFFGLVTGLGAQNGEWGYFSLAELEAIRGPWGLQGVERDSSWNSITLADAAKFDRALRAQVEAA